MKAKKQQSIFKFCQKKPSGENQVSGVESVERIEVEAATSTLQHAPKRPCSNVHVDHTETIGKRKTATEVLGPEAANKLPAIPLSNDSVNRRILDMAVDVEEQVIEQVKKSKYFAIQLDESRDLGNCSNPNCFVRYENEGRIIEEFLCCLQLSGRTTSSEIFRSLNNYVQDQGLDWEKCVREVANKNILITHCVLHRENLFAKKLFPELNDVLNGAVKIDVVTNSSSPNTEELFSVISQHLKDLRISFGKYFPENADPRQGNFWIVNPFAKDNDSYNLNTVEKESLIELSCDTTLMSKHKELSLSQFWISLENEYPELSDIAIKILLVFCTTYLCEKSFSTLTLIKTKQRNRVKINALLRLAETSLEPRLAHLISKGQQQNSP
uniref:SCAN domain-containing protein 3-like n=1 Tax=Styela clava TaxID=7725 RepID=UPI00193A1761|nr:SCAN domain-containing protein 3-like [Styela clava]